MYEPRRAAYAVVRGPEAKIAVVQTSSGYFLPGGGALPDEAPEETVTREVREELARDVKIVCEIGEAIQYFYAEGKHFRMEARFFEVELRGEAGGQGEHQLCWLDQGELEGAFFHESHAWAATKL